MNPGANGHLRNNATHARLRKEERPKKSNQSESDQGRI